jgi:hypothetical protein
MFNEEIIMRKTVFVLSGVISAFAAGIASANDNIAIDLSVAGEITPGVYGRVNIGNTRPEVVYEQPVIIKKVKHESDPIYLHVPPGHAKHWDKHCAEYNACDRKVYFVKSREYDDDYGHSEHGNHNKHDRDHDREEGHHDEGRGNHGRD